MAKANGEQMKWKSGTFGINCCVNAFSPNFSCRLAFCPDCFGTRTANNKEEKNKRRRAANKRSGGSAAKTTGENRGGNCDNHTIADLTSKGFDIMTDASYLKWKRKDSMTGYENIANTCYDCGVRF